MKKLLAAGSALVVGLALPVTGAAPASALTTTKGYAGACRGVDALTGTTIVVDFQKLNGNAGRKAPTITRCSPNRAGYIRNGITALQDAGFALTGTTGWGYGFLCRIENRPAAAEVLKRASNASYKETCGTTPPADAFWSYWYADGSASSWTSSPRGALQHTVVPGGYEGWSFTWGLATTATKPRVTPRNAAIVATTPTASLQRSDVDGVITLGKAVKLTWYTRFATTHRSSQSAVAAGGFYGTVAATGSKVVKPTRRGTYTYAIRVTNSAGRAATSIQHITVK